MGSAETRRGPIGSPSAVLGGGENGRAGAFHSGIGLRWLPDAGSYSEDEWIQLLSSSTGISGD